MPPETLNSEEFIGKLAVLEVVEGPLQGWFHDDSGIISEVLKNLTSDVDF